MDLKEFREYIQSFPVGKEFNYGISAPFSWRGVYAEVAFEVLLSKPMTREQILSNINDAYINTFGGYKGGEYSYDDYTEVHFEENYGRWTDGRYCAEIIAKLEDEDIYTSQEMRMVSLLFPENG